MEYFYKHYQYQPPTRHLNRVALHSLLKIVIESLQGLRMTEFEDLELEAILGMEGYAELYVFDKTGLQIHIYQASDYKTICVRYRSDPRTLSIISKLIPLIENNSWVAMEDPCEE